MSALRTGFCRPGIILYLAAIVLLSHRTFSAPLQDSDSTQLADIEGGCYYNFQHYQEGARIATNEPCLNCTCHNKMLMCYLRVCPFTKAIGQDCTIEKRPDQCCPVITCPEVPVPIQMLTSTTSAPKILPGPTDLALPDDYGCSVNERFYADGAQLPIDFNNPCELCYCIRNRTTCLMQQCTLTVVGCKPVYQSGTCCPVKYNCEYDEDMDTTAGLIITTTLAPRDGPPHCVHEEKIYEDGELIYTVEPCQHCYCLHGRIVCAKQECEKPLEFHGKNCTSLPPLDSYCCPTYHCEPGNTTLETTDKFPGDDNSIPGESIKQRISTSERPPTASGLGNDIPQSEQTKLIVTESIPTQESFTTLQLDNGESSKTTEEPKITSTDSSEIYFTSTENKFSHSTEEKVTETPSRIGESVTNDMFEFSSSEPSRIIEQSTESNLVNGITESYEKLSTEDSDISQKMSEITVTDIEVTEKSSVEITTENINQNEEISESFSPDNLQTSSESNNYSETNELIIPISSMKTDSPINIVPDENVVTTAAPIESFETKSTQQYIFESISENTQSPSEESQTEKDLSTIATSSGEDNLQKSESVSLTSNDNVLTKDEEGTTVTLQEEIESTERTETKNIPDIVDKESSITPSIMQVTESSLAIDTKIISDEMKEADATGVIKSESISPADSESITPTNINIEKQEETIVPTTVQSELPIENNELLGHKFEQESLAPSNDQTGENSEDLIRGPSGISIPERGPEHKAEDKDAVTDEITQANIPSNDVSQDDFEMAVTTYLPPSFNNEIDRHPSTPLSEDLTKQYVVSEAASVVTPDLLLESLSTEHPIIHTSDFNLENAQNSSDELTKDIITKLPISSELEVSTKTNEIELSQEINEKITEPSEKVTDNESITEATEADLKIKQETDIEEKTEKSIEPETVSEIVDIESETNSPVDIEQPIDVLSSEQPIESDTIVDTSKSTTKIHVEEPQMVTKSYQDDLVPITIPFSSESSSSLSITEDVSKQPAENEETSSAKVDEPSSSQNEISAEQTNHQTETNEISLDMTPLSGIPGEGNCLVDGQTYTNNSAVPQANECQLSCQCISSIVDCKLIPCAPAPANFTNCRPSYSESNLCCPMYICENDPNVRPPDDNQIREQIDGDLEKLPVEENSSTSESAPLKVDNQLSHSTESFKLPAESVEDTPMGVEEHDDKTDDVNENIHNKDEVSLTTPKVIDLVSFTEKSIDQEKTTILNDIRIQTGEVTESYSENKVVEKSDENLSSTFETIIKDLPFENPTNEYVSSTEIKSSTEVSAGVIVTSETPEEAHTLHDEVDTVTLIPVASPEDSSATETEYNYSSIRPINIEEQYSLSPVEKEESEITQNPLETDNSSSDASNILENAEKATTVESIETQPESEIQHTVTEITVKNYTDEKISDTLQDIIAMPNSSEAPQDSTLPPSVSQEVLSETVTKEPSFEVKVSESPNDAPEHVEDIASTPSPTLTIHGFEYSTSIPTNDEITEKVIITEIPDEQKKETINIPEDASSPSDIIQSETPEYVDLNTYTSDEPSSSINVDQAEGSKDTSVTEASTPEPIATQVYDQSSQQSSITPAEISEVTQKIIESFEVSNDSLVLDIPSSESPPSQELSEKESTITLESLSESSSVSSIEEEQHQDSNEPLKPEPTQKPVEPISDFTSPAPHKRPESPDEHISETDDPSDFPPDNGDITPSDPDDYSDDTSIFGPGTCRYGGKIYMSAQQIPRDDPCDFCFCFRSDIICLQQSCPPPITACTEQPIPGFCCPRYSCPVSMASPFNATTTTTTTTTQSPYLYSSTYKENASQGGCEIGKERYQIGQIIRSKSGPCMNCMCGGDGKMQCEPKSCMASPMLKEIIAHAAARKRRRRSINS